MAVPLRVTFDRRANAAYIYLTEVAPGGAANQQLVDLPHGGTFILDRRQRLGPFQSTEQLRDEKLIPAATYDRIKDLITVN